VITGPQAITHAQIADELAAVTGHTVRYVDKLRPRSPGITDAGLPPWLVTHIDGAYGLIRRGELAVPTDSVRRHLRRPAHSLADWAKANAAFFGARAQSAVAELG
jgi:NAD(P)H dehydrogenase (quinone)